MQFLPQLLISDFHIHTMLRLAQRSLCMLGHRSAAPIIACQQKHTLPDLPYDYLALEPTINAEIMEIHHSKHHATYERSLHFLVVYYRPTLFKNEFTFLIRLYILIY